MSGFQAASRWFAGQGWRPPLGQLAIPARAKRCWSRSMECGSPPADNVEVPVGMVVSPQVRAGGEHPGRKVDSPLDTAALIEEVRAGDRRALARTISAIEEDAPEASALIEGFSTPAGGVRRIGITGAPGVGKSTLVAGLISHIRRDGATVAVIAVDPSSPLTGGAILGDRIRMQEHVGDPGVYVRSMAGRGHLGGLSAAAPRVALVLEGAGFGYILIETVGVGQSEVEVMRHVHSTVVVVTPGWGDSVQVGKAGLMEIGDVFVVNKADQPGAARARRDLETMLAMGPHRAWQPPVVETVATEGTGLDGLWEHLRAHAAHLARSGQFPVDPSAPDRI